MINGYEQGSDITLLNTMYCFPKKDDNGKYDKGSITLVYRDNITGQKKKEEITNPDYEYYRAKENEYIDTNLLFIEEDRVDKVTVPYNELDKNVAEFTGNMAAFKDNIRNGNRYANKMFHQDPRVFMSDFNVEDHYRFRFDKTYTNNIFSISKAYFDIEADTINMKGDFPEMGECPVNAITIINEKDNKVYTLLLRNSENPLIEEFEKSICNDTFIELKDLIRKQVGGYKNEIRYGLDKLDFEIMFYDEEIHLIHDLFEIINVKKPDFVLAWNMAFDIPYIIERIKVLGYRPEDIMCHPDFKIKKATYYIDERNKNDFAERGDFASISSYSVFLDQMVQFASRRKGQGAFASFGLDYIGEVVSKIRKLDYSHITTSIAKFPWINYKLFVFYNIVDTIVQKCVEHKTGDTDYIFNKCLLNNTRYQKGHRQTVYLTNRGAKEFYQTDNLIMGNNLNRGNEKPTEKFPGALVADPSKLSDYSMKCINGIPAMLFDILDDYDFKALYPSLMREMNIAANTQIGMIIMEKQIHDKENPFKVPTYSRGGSFVEDFHSHVWLEFCHRWLHLADYMTLYKDVEKYFGTVKNPGYCMKQYNKMSGMTKVVEFFNKDLTRRAVSFDKELRPAVNFYKKPELDVVKEHFKIG